MGLPLLRGFTAPVITTGAILSPASTQAGDLMIFVVWSQNASVTPTHTRQSGFFAWRDHPHDDGTADGRASVAVMQAASPGAASYTPYVVTNAAANQTSGCCYVIQAGTWDPGMLTVAPTIASLTSTNTTAPNPPSVASLTGDFHMLAIGIWHVTTAGSTDATAGANYPIATEGPAGSHVTHIAIATRDLTSLSGATEDPPIFTDNVTPNGTVAITIAVIGYTAAARNAGIASTAPAGIAELDGVITVAGAIASSSPAATASTIGTVEVAAAITSTAPAAITSLEGTVPDGPPPRDATIVSTAPAQVASIGGTVAVQAAPASTAPAPVAELAATVGIAASPDSTAPAPVTELAATVHATSEIVSTGPAAQSSSSSSVTIAAAIESTAPAAITALVGTTSEERGASIVSTAPAASASIGATVTAGVHVDSLGPAAQTAAIGTVESTARIASVGGAQAAIGGGGEISANIASTAPAGIAAVASIAPRSPVPVYKPRARVEITAGRAGGLEGEAEFFGRGRLVVRRR